MFNFLKSKETKIFEFKMPATMMFRLAFDNQWDLDSCQRYIKEYKKFMLLASKKESVPSQIVDLVWHEHILHTKLYEEFCKILGKFIHHNPTHTPNKYLYQETKHNYESSGFVDSNSADVWGDFSANTSTDNSFDGGEFGGSGAGCASCASCGGGGD